MCNINGLLVTSDLLQNKTAEGRVDWVNIHLTETHDQVKGLCLLCFTQSVSRQPFEMQLTIIYNDGRAAHSQQLGQEL